MKSTFKILICGFVWCVLSKPMYAQQYSVVHHAPTMARTCEDLALDFMVMGVLPSDFTEAYLFYRFDNDVAFQQKEIFYRDGSFTAVVNDIEATSAEIEYYFMVRVNESEPVYYPETFQINGPVRLNVVTAQEQQAATKKHDAVDFTILSPEPGSIISGRQILVSVALFYNEGVVGPGEFSLYIDDKNVSKSADIDPYYISYLAKGIENGPHKIRIEYATQTERFLINEWEMSTLGSAPDAMVAGDLPASGIQRSAGNIELGARNQVIGGDVNNAYTGRSTISGKIGLFRYSLNGFFTSQESMRLQPQNRFGLDLQLGNWWRLQAGHVYPSMSQFTINGNRVYGLNTELHTPGEGINLQFIYGDLRRKVTNLYTNIDRTETVLGGQVADTTYTLNYQDGGKGTLRRGVIGGRLAIGKASKFQFGLQAMKIQDDTTSVYNVRSFSDVISGKPELYAQFSPQDIVKLSQTPKLLNVQSGPLDAKGNFIMGTDIKMAFAKNRIKLNGEGAVSLLNNNIYGGILNAERADDMGFELPEKGEKILDVISKLIIINENMDVLPVKFTDFGSDDASADFFLPIGLLAGTSELSVNYPANNLKMQYRWIGPDFNSLANSTIRKDIAGITVSDRFGLLRNRLFITLGYEQLKDNLIGRKSSTTKSVSYKTNVGWYPISGKLPRINVGFRYRDRDNGLIRLNPYLPSDLQIHSMQNFEIIGSDTLMTAPPKTNSTLDYSVSVTQQLNILETSHDISVNYSSLKTSDKVFYFGDVSSNMFSLDITTRYERSFTTSAGFSINSTVTGNGMSDMTITGFYVGGNYFMPQNNLSFNAQVAVTSNNNKSRVLETQTVNPLNSGYEYGYYKLADFVSHDKFNSFMLQAGAQYNINKHHSVLARANVTNVSGTGMTGDRILQLSYVFKF